MMSLIRASTISRALRIDAARGELARPHRDVNGDLLVDLLGEW
jgi:hypothetical protein